MSKAARRSDAEKTAIMLDLLHRTHENHGVSRRHVVLEEVAPATGYGAGWSDAVVLGMWQSEGQRLAGFELKASRADLRRELADPGKWRAVGKYCDTWTLIAWDEAMLVDGVPPEWGIIVTRETEHEDRELHQLRKPMKLDPLPWPRSFVCSLVRNAFEQSTGAQYLARAVEEANKRGRRDGQEIERLRWEHELRPVMAAVFGREEWRWPRVDAPDLAREIAAQLTKTKLMTGTPS